jgi:alpha-beta hydrolase superfamily lysophospholipase
MRKAGYASIIPDQRGHGEPPEGVKNWHGLIPDYQCFVDDIISLTQYVLEKAPGTPVVLYGHSMGGNIVLNTLLQSSDRQASQAKQALLYSCAVIESPWLGLYNPPNKIKLGLMKFLSRVLPNLRQEQKLNHGDLSGDTERSGGYSKDPLYHGFISMRMVAGILGGCDFAMSNAARLSVPTYIAYASDELVVCNKTIRKFAKKAADVVTLKEYDSKHAIHNDKNRELFFNDMIAYMDSKYT